MASLSSTLLAEATPTSFSSPDQVGLQHSLASHAGWRLVTAERIEAMLRDLEPYGTSELHQELSLLADEVGPGGMVQLWVEEDEKARTLRLRWTRPGQRLSARRHSLVRSTAALAGALASGFVVSIPLSALDVRAIVPGLVSLLVSLVVLHWLGLRLTGTGLWPWARRKIPGDEEGDELAFSELVLHAENSGAERKSRACPARCRS